jgi:hypothetical protein
MVSGVRMADLVRKEATTSDYRRLNLTVIQHDKILLIRALGRRGLFESSKFGKDCLEEKTPRVMRCWLDSILLSIPIRDASAETDHVKILHLHGTIPLLCIPNLGNVPQLQCSKPKDAQNDCQRADITRSLWTSMMRRRTEGRDT